jgi:hypothetical protein
MQPRVNIVSLLMTMLREWIGFNFQTFIPCTTKEFTLTHYFFCAFRFNMLLVSFGYFWYSVLPRNCMNSSLITAACYKSS